MKPSRQMIAVGIVAIGAIAATVVLTFEMSRKGRTDKSQLPVPTAPMPPAEVRVKAVERRAESLERGDGMRVERVAALKNDVMNLLRGQEPPVGYCTTGRIENECN